MSSWLKTQIYKYRFPILSGVLIGTSYIPFPPWAAFFGFAPLWWFWIQENRSYKEIFLSGWISQFLLTLIGFNWVAHTVKEFGMLPMPVAIVVLLLFCSFANLHVVLAGLAWKWISARGKLSQTSTLILLPLLLSIGQISFPMIFDWHFGYTWLWAKFPAAHTGEIWGMEFLGILTIFFNLPFLMFWRFGPRLKIGAGICATFAALNIAGYTLKQNRNAPDASLNGLIVQANIGNAEKIYAEKGVGYVDEIIRRFFNLTKEGLKQSRDQGNTVDFAIWPETAFPSRIHTNNLRERYTLRMRNFLKRNEVGLFAGSYGTDISSGLVSNSLFVFDNKGQLTSPPYTKTILLAFGEFIPGDWLYPKVYDLLPMVAHFARGDGPKLQLFKGVKLGPQICYEGLFDWFSRESVNMGAQILVNVTNDSWYGKWQQPYQHLYMTLSRAIEVRRPLIRSTNTGISTVILADGTILEQSPLHKPWKQLYNIPYESHPSLTIFSSWGYWIRYGFLLLIGAGIFVLRKQNTQFY